jgi:hypothetical protein
MAVITDPLEAIKDPLEEELSKYENKWVAILESERRVVASGDRAIDAMHAAEAQGYGEIALFKVRSFGKLYVYQA